MILHQKMKQENLSPLAYLSFKKVFGEHPPLLINFVNSVLQLENPVIKIEYLQLEYTAESPANNNKDIQLLCKDEARDSLVVKVQILKDEALLRWAILDDFSLFTLSQNTAYNSRKTKPVFSIYIIEFEQDGHGDQWLHNYSLANKEIPNDKLEGFQVLLLDLPKFRKKAHFNLSDSLAVWAKYFTEPAFFITLDKQEMEKIPQIEKAIALLNYSHYSINQLLAHGEDADVVLTWNDSIRSAWENGKENGKLEGIALTLDIIKSHNEGTMNTKELVEKYNINAATLDIILQQQSIQGLGTK
jgi:hypothetical protein